VPLPEQDVRGAQVEFTPGATDDGTARSRSRQPGHRPLAQQTPLELGEDSTQLEGHPAHRRGAVESGVGEGHELDAVAAEQVEQIQDVRQAAPEAVEPGDDHHVDLVSRDLFEQGIERGTAIPTAGDTGVHVLGDEVPAALASSPADRLYLDVGVLVARRDPAVGGHPRRSRHDRDPPRALRRGPEPVDPTGGRGRVAVTVPEPLDYRSPGPTTGEEVAPKPR
jgi:hypothetical protein